MLDKIIQNPIKSGVSVLAGVVGAVLALNSFTIVPVGEEASVSSFGEVKEGKILTGFNFVLPWWSIDNYNLQTRTLTYEDLGIASQDKFKTNMDVNFTGQFLPNSADMMRKNTGTARVYLDTHVNKRVLSCLTKAGGDVESSQSFFEKSTQETLANYTVSCVNEYLDKVGGYKLTSIQFSDIRLDPVVKNFMVKTKERQEEENQAASELAIAETIAQKVVKTSAANLLAAENDKLSRMKSADAALYEKQKEAEGNLVLSKSINEGLVKYIEAQRWDGVRSKIVAGSGTDLLVDTRSK